MEPNFAAFRLRALQDFPNDAIAANLLRAPPAEHPHHAQAAWLSFAADAMEPVQACAPELALALADTARAIRAAAPDNPTLELQCTEALASFALVRAESEPAEALAVFQEEVDRAIERGPPRLPWAVSRFGQTLGHIRLEAEDSRAADTIFERLRELAHRATYGDEPEELADDCARLGISIYYDRLGRGATSAAAAMERTLWGHPSAGEGVDLASSAGMVLMECSRAGEYEWVYAELKERAEARPDVPAVGFWAANVGWSLVGEAQRGGQMAAFLDYLHDLIAWVQPRANDQDMPDIVWEMVGAGWITEDFNLGREAVQALYDLYRATQGATSAKQPPPNHAALLAAELLTALDAEPEALWSKALRLQLLRKP